MYEIDTNDDPQLILPKRNSVSRFQAGSSILNSGSERKRSLHINKNQQQSQVRRKIDFDHDQDTLTFLPEINLDDIPSNTIKMPTLESYVEEFRKGYMNYEIPGGDNKNNSGLIYDGTKLPKKSSFKKKNNIPQKDESVNLSNGSPLKSIDANVLPQPKKSSFFTSTDRNNSRNSGIFENQSNSKQKSNNFEKFKKIGNEIGVKIARPSEKNNQNVETNTTKTMDLTEGDTFFTNLIKKEKLIDFGDIDNDTEIQSSFTNNNSNTSIPTLPPRKKTQRKPFALKVYDDDVSNNKKDLQGALPSNLPANNFNDEDTTQNNNGSFILPKKGVKFGQKKNNNNYETNNSIDTMFIAQTVSKQPMLLSLNPDETNTNMNMSFNHNLNSSMNGSMNNSLGRKNNVKFVNNSNNRNNEIKTNDFLDFNPNDDEEDDVTKADIDPEFESEHSAILAPDDLPNTNKFNSNSINTNYNNSAANFIFNTNDNLSHNSGILKNGSKSKLDASGSFISNINSKLGADLFTNTNFDISLITESIRGLFSNQLAALATDMRQKANNHLQLTNSAINRLTNPNIGNNTYSIANILNENRETATTLMTYYSLNASNEILGNLQMLHENKQFLCRKIMHSAKTLKFTIATAIEELHRPKSTMKDVMDAIAKFKEKKNNINNNENDGSEFIQKYLQLKSAIPFKISSLTSVNAPLGFNKDPSTLLVKCTYRANEQKMELNNAERLHVEVSKLQRFRKLKNEIEYLMTIVPHFIYDRKNSKFSCVISSNDQTNDKRIRFLIVVNVPSFYPWCFLSVESIRVDYGVTYEEVREKIESILSSMKISSHQLTDLVQALINEYN